jgi:ribosomal protein S18 acetylase RimI-like enzyme
MPEFRGMGVGRRLWEDGIIPWCIENGFSHLGAMVMAHNVGSIGFYEKLGFRVVGYHNSIVRWDDEYLDSVEIERILDL